MRRLTILFLLLAGLWALPLSGQVALYVSPDGDDAATGTIEAPFKGIDKALEEARRRQAGEITIFLRGGEYHIPQTLVLTADDGNDQRRLTLRAYYGERAVIKGSLPLALSWEPYKNGIMRAHVSLATPPDMLIVDDSIRPMARYPNYDPDARKFNGTAADATAPERVKGWKNPRGGFLHAMHVGDWGDFHYRVTGKDKENHLELEGGWQNNRPDGISPEQQMVENIFEELDAPGEWYYDSRAAMLYYYPLPGENIQRATFEVPRLKHLIELRGTETEPARNIRVQGITLTQTVRTFMEPYEPLLRSDWTIYRGGAILLEETENCEIVDCDLYNLGGNGIFLSMGNKGARITGSHLSHIGASAICLVGDPKAVRSPSFQYGQFVPLEEMDLAVGPKNDHFPTHCLISDNLIHDFGLFEKQSTGVELSMCQYATVSHNSIYNAPRSGINVSEGTWGGHVIEFNDVFNTVRETGDHGSFNSWGRDRFWHPDRAVMDQIVATRPSLILADATATITIKNNRFRCDHGWDIDLDDGSSNYHIHDNLCLNGGIKLREGFYRVVENNILVNNTFHPHVWFSHSGDIFTRNIVMSPYQPVQIKRWGALVDYNIFTDSTAYAAARENQTDSHSIVCPVRFLDPSKGDFRVSNEDIEVFRLGFQNFEMDRFGVISPRLRALRQTPEISSPTFGHETAQADGITWHGWRVKNLETLGERSATGMDSERGVYIISLSDAGSPLKETLRPNDVILELNGHPTDNLDDLLEAEKAAAGLEKTLKVRRDQKDQRIVIPANILQ